MRVVRGILGFSLALVATVVALDAYIQLAEIQSPMESRMDDRLGPLYAPGINFSRFSEGFFLGGANEWRYLGQGVPRRRAGDEKRVLFLGDSYALGHTVFERHHFKNELSSRLSAGVGVRVEALNFARADYCLWNMYQHYVDYASEWNHELVLFFLDTSDISADWPADPQMYPYAELAADSLVINRSFAHSAKHELFVKIEPLLVHASTPRLFFNLLKVIGSGQWKAVLFGKLAPAPSQEVDAAIPGAPRLKLADRPMPETSRRILDVLGRDPRAVAVLMEDIPEEYRRELQDSGIRVVELEPLWARMEADGVDPYWWPVTRERGHWNQGAHRQLGIYLARRILDDDLLIAAPLAPPPLPPE